ncbi:MAG: acyltransferase [Ruminococcaceae bacterium]|nr:acyltransferase [Oscillospiraceae bacterium]
MNSKRIVGLDILRFFSMLGIVGLHVINAGGMLDGNASKLNMGISGILLVICYSSVNIFAMLSGYLYAGRENIKSSNLIKLLISTVFFCAAVTVSFLAFKAIPDNTAKLTFQGFFPFAAGRYWYLVCYIFLFLMIPYINKLTAYLSQRSFCTMLIILFLLLSVYDTASPVKYFYVGDGYSPVWLIFCYLTGSYVKLHSEVFRKLSPTLCIFLSLVSNAIAFGIWFLFKKTAYYHYNSPFTVISAVMLLIGFSKINFQSPFITKVFRSLSDSAFSVYIIHAHMYIMDYLLTGCLNSYLKSNPVIVLCLTLGIIIAVYFAGWLAHIIKQFIFRFARLDKAADFLGSKLDWVLHQKITN